MSRQILMVVGLLALDRIVKLLALKQIFVQSWFRLFLNDGIVFSLLPNSPIVTGLALIMLFMVIWVLLKSNDYPSWLRWALLLIAAGASSNLYDRLVYGSVIDYLNLSTHSTLNFADLYLLIGVGLLILKYIPVQPGIDKSANLG